MTTEGLFVVIFSLFFFLFGFLFGILFVQNKIKELLNIQKEFFDFKAFILDFNLKMNDKIINLGELLKSHIDRHLEYNEKIHEIIKKNFNN